MSSDRIEKSVLINAARARVWRALTDHREFSEWFRVNLDGPFVAGRKVTGRITYSGYEHLKWEATIEKIEPQKLFSFRWHPYAIDPKVDYSKELTTLIEFTLADAEGGTLLKVVESGFDQISASRRAETFRMNDQGWGIQMENIRAYVAGPV